MLPIARRHSHYVFAVLQSGLTTLIASGIASSAVISEGGFLRNWLSSWVTAWALMVPVVVIAAPTIRRMAVALTRPEASDQPGR